MTEFMTIWTLYDHPLDFPDKYVARRYVVTKEGPITRTEDLKFADTLEELRDEMRDLHLFPVERFPDDDPKIVEVWL